MAYTRKTIINRMLESSGRTAQEVSKAIGEDASFIDRILSGDLRPTTNQLNRIASRCDYEVAFIGHGETLALAKVELPREFREYEGGVANLDNEFSGKTVAVTGALYGYRPGAQSDLLKDIGAIWVERVKILSTDYLIVGSDIPDGHVTNQMGKVMRSNRSKTKMIRAEEFRKRFKELTGRDIAEE